MLTVTPDGCCLLVIDFQSRLMPAIENGERAVANGARLVSASALLGVPTFYTEQNPRGPGATVPELTPAVGADLTHKTTFDAVRAHGFLCKLPPETHIVVAGCEAHVCVLQSVLGLLAAGRRVFVVADAIGSRRSENKEVAVRRMERHGAEIVTTEMVIFEWLGSAEHPRFRETLALVK